MLYKKRILITNVTNGIPNYEIKYFSTIDNAYDFSEIITELFSNLNIVERQPTTGDKLYILSGCNIPRFKMKDYCANKGSKVVKFIESSNLVIYSDDGIKKLYEFIDHRRIDKAVFSKYVNLKLIEDPRSEYFKELYALVQEIDEDVCLATHYNVRQHFKDNGFDFSDISRVGYWALNEHNNGYIQKIINTKSELILENVILKEINGSMVMDDDVYEQIKSLIESSDNENIKLAMELMSNCDYNKSSLYLLLLFERYGRKFERQHNKNHVNFKSLLTYFGLQTKHISIYTDDILEILKEKNLLTPEKFSKLKPLVLENFNDSSKHYSAADILFLDDNGEVIPEFPTETKMVAVNEPINIDLLSEIKEVDLIVLDEMTEVIDNLRQNNRHDYADIVLNVNLLQNSPEELFEIIKYFDSTYQYELAALLTQSYLSL
jgi:hypothetical protein